MDTTEQNKSALIKDIADAIAEHGDLVQICELARTAISELIPCDQVIILRHDEEFQRFTVTPALNQGTRFSHSELVLPHDECACCEALVNQKSVEVRSSEGHSLCKAEETLIGHSQYTVLIIPINWARHVLGAIHMVRHTDSSFTLQEGSIAEETATLLAVAFERAKVIAKSEVIEEAANQWREKYFRLFETVNQALIVVDADIDVIYETNNAAAELSGYERTELHAMTFSSLFSAESIIDLEEITQNARHENHAAVAEAELVRKNQERLNVYLHVGKMELADRARYIIAISLKESADDEKVKEAEEPALTEIPSLPFAFDLENFDESLDTIFIETGHKLGARFGAVHAVAKAGRELHLVRIRRFPEHLTGETDELADRFTEAPFETAWKSDDIVECSSISEHPNFTKTKNIAEELGYDSYFSFPVRIGSRTYGALTFFFDGISKFSTDQKNLLRQAAQQVAVLFHYTRMQRQADQHVQRCQGTLEIVSAVSGITDLHEILEKTANELNKYIQFDLLSISLLNYEDENIRLKCIASEKLANNMQTEFEWSRSGHSELGWLKLKNEVRLPGAPSLDVSLEKKLKSKISVLLIARDKYLGNIALGSLKENAFIRKDIEFLKTMSPSLSIFIEQAQQLVEEKMAEESGELVTTEESLQSVLTEEEIPDELPDKQSAAAPDTQQDGVKKLQKVVFGSTAEMKNIVASLKGYSSMLSEGSSEDIDDEGKHYIERILGSVTKLEHIVTSLIDLTRSFGSSREDKEE